MRKKQNASKTTCYVVGGLIGLVAGAFIPDTLNPATLVKKLITKKTA